MQFNGSFESSKPRKNHTKPCLQGFTRVELAVVVAVLAILACLLLAVPSKAKVRSNRINCAGNLKRIGVGYRLYANDNKGSYPRFTPKLGTLNAWSNFAFAIQPEFTDAKELICPADSARLNFSTNRLPASFSATTNGLAGPANLGSWVSYFYGLASDETWPSTLLAGDRNLTAGQASNPNGPDVSPRWSYAGRGPVSLGSGLKGSVPPNCGWNSALHHFTGNVLLGDGSVQQDTTPALIEQLKMSADTNNIFVFPAKSPGEK